MQSESARATTAAESRYRVRTPNARPRSVTVVPLDEGTAALAAALSRAPWRGVTFLPMPLPTPPPAPDAAPGAAPDAAPDPGGFGAWLRLVTGQAREMAEEIGRVDVVQMLLTAGQDAPAAALIGEAALLRGVKTSGLIIDDAVDGRPGASAEALTRSLLALRPWVVTLSVLGSADSVDAILHALGG